MADPITDSSIPVEGGSSKPVYITNTELNINADTAIPVSISDPIEAKGIDLSVTTAISGQITVETAGTAVQGGNIALTNGVYIKALSTNTGLAYVGNDGAGDVTSANGFELSASDMILVQVDNLNKLWFDVSESGEDLCWIKA